MNKIYGRDTSLTLLKDNVYTPLCYTEETIRKTAVDYELNATIGKAQRETRQQADTRIEGCFVTRLDADATAPLFDIVSEDGETFTLLADRVFSKNIFTNLKAQSLELRAENGEPFYFRVDIQETRNSTVEQFNHLTPAVKWNTNRESEDDRLWENENGSVGIDSSTSLRSAQNDTSGFSVEVYDTTTYRNKAIIKLNRNGQNIALYSAVIHGRAIISEPNFCVYKRDDDSIREFGQTVKNVTNRYMSDDEICGVPFCEKRVFDLLKESNKLRRSVYLTTNLCLCGARVGAFMDVRLRASEAARKYQITEINFYYKKNEAFVTGLWLRSN